MRGLKKDIPLNEEHKNKISQSMMGKNTWMVGKKHQKKTKEKMSRTRSRKITFRGIVYQSTKEACRLLSFSPSKLLYRIKHGLEYSTEDEIKEFIRKRKREFSEKRRDKRNAKKEK